MCLKSLNKVAPGVEDQLRNQIVAVMAAKPGVTIKQIVENIDTTLLPSKPEGARWTGNPFAPMVVVTEIVTKLLDNGTADEDLSTMTYRLRYECGWAA